MMSQLLPPPPPKRQERQPRSVLLPLLLFLLALLLFIALIGSFLLLSGFRQPRAQSAKPNSVLRLVLGGELPEVRLSSGMEALTGQRSFAFHDYLSTIEKAKADAKITGMVLELSPLQVGFAQLDELRSAIGQFRSAGKWAICYGESWAEAEYYLASSCDQIVLPPESFLMLDGFMARATFYRDVLDWVGIKVDVAAFREYKNFADAYRYNQMSDPHKEALNRLLQFYHQRFVDQVAQARQITADQVETALQLGTFEASKARDAGLIDLVGYRDDVVAEVMKRLEIEDKESVRWIEAKRYFVPGRPASMAGSQVAVLLTSGGIQSGNADRSTFGNPVVGSEWFVEELHKIRRDSRIKALVVRIDSPGGSALASDVMWRELQNLQQEGFPVVASMGNVAASGGYYLAMGCPVIFAEPTTITGSIGVISMRLDFSKLYEHLKMRVEVLKTAPMADFFDPYRSATDEELQAFLARTEVFYRGFVEKAASSRGHDFETFEPHARGRVWVGSDALERGLVDHLGGLSDAVSHAAKLADLEKFSTRYFPEEKGLMEILRQAEPQVSTDAALARFIPEPAQALIELGQHTAPLQPCAILPFYLEIQ
jgi:protease-4